MYTTIVDLLSRLWPVIGPLSAAVAAIAAAAQILLSRRESRRRATFEHIREVVSALRLLWPYDAQRLQKSAIAFYDHIDEEMEPQVADYLAFLESLDILALAVEKKAVDVPVATEYVRTLFKGDLVSLAFLEDFQRCCKDKDTFWHLRKFAEQFNSSPQRKAAMSLTDVTARRDQPPPPPKPPTPSRPPAPPRPSPPPRPPAKSPHTEERPPLPNRGPPSTRPPRD